MAQDPTARTIAGIILAAGKGTRMRSSLPKVLHKLAGRPMLEWVCGALRDAGVERQCLVLSEELDGFAPFLEERPELTVAIQKNRAGTGDAVASAAFAFAGVGKAPFAAGRVLTGTAITATHALISAGDTPALSPATIKAFIEESLAAKAAVSVLGMRVPNPFGYGRMLIEADGRTLTGIVEEKDATPEQRRLTACNTGIIFAETATLFGLVAALTADNAQKEYYLTDCVKHARSRGLVTHAVVVDDWESFAGINDRLQLAELEQRLVARLLARLMAGGTTVRAPQTVHVEAGVESEADVEVGAGAVLLGRTLLGKGSQVGPGATLTDVRVGPGAAVGAGSVLAGCAVAPGEKVPPLSVRLG
jgi:bifunctional UDP-N-acetylglucosamine pyrophosphorylase/glucosamine-1-phosphate N-acetyltransferase